MKLLLSLFLSLFIITSFAQKTKNVALGQYKYVQPPANMVLQQYKTFYVEPYSNADAAVKVRKECKITGFTKTSNQVEADFTVRHQVRPLSFTKPEYSKKSSTREKDGVKTTTTTHKYSGSCAYGITVKIYSTKNNELLYTTTWEGSWDITGKSTAGSSAAYTNYSNQKESKKRTYVKTGVKALNSRIDDELAYKDEIFVIKACQVKAKKYNYDDYNGAVETLKLYLNEADKAAKSEALGNAIKLWESEIPNADLESKKARINKKVLAGAHYNIGLAHFVMYNYEEAKAALEKALEYDSVSMYHKPLIKECEKQIPRKVNLK